MLRRVPLLCCLCLALAPGLARAGKLPSDGEDAFNKVQRAKRENVTKLLSGQSLTAQEMTDTIQFLAKWHTYRLTWASSGKEGAVKGLLDEVDSDLSRASKNLKAGFQQQFLQPYATQLAVCAREVLEAGGDDEVKSLARVNVVRVLDRAAKDGAEELADTFVDILRGTVKDASGNALALDDGVKYWALQGLRDLFALGHVSPEHPTPVYFKNKDREKAAILALNEFVLRKLDLPPSMPREEVEGQRVLRREAVKALALTRYPLVEDPAGHGQTALVLLRVARKDGFTPEPKIDEQVEAANGLARMQSDLYANYQPDYAAYHVGRVVQDLADSYQKWQADVALAGADTKPLPDIQYKIAAARLNEALGFALKRDVEKNRKGDKETLTYVNGLILEAVKPLNLLETAGSVNGPAANFAAWLDGHRPASTTIYKGVADAKVKDGAAGQ
jgi:hypothetical protein